MWNPRLISEDAGDGVNVRQLRRYFLCSFTTVYSMRPLAAGAVLMLSRVFYDDKDRLGKYLLAKELVSRPDAEELEIIFGNAGEKSEQGPSLFSQAAVIFSSLNRFMKAISK
ncbi:putative pentatricopeptide repeat-containing protein [Hibiscus syriacus]|uniref:Pentatricopeptide repeat-containing protein n=1 Tax=Hibiscus syriacus TaxID=106335 RepID=A0A6A3C9V7_HIBSY|nr:putative pentatricopeptide repeat-containing protein [Hibiscus syriacus]